MLHRKGLIMFSHLGPIMCQLQTRDGQQRPHDIIAFQPQLHSRYPVEIPQDKAFRQRGICARGVIMQQLQMVKIEVKRGPYSRRKTLLWRSGDEVALNIVFAAITTGRLSFIALRRRVNSLRFFVDRCLASEAPG